MSGWGIRGKRVLITGGTAGIGLRTAVALASRGARVVITARDEEKAKRARESIATESNADVDSVLLDLASFDSIRACAREIAARFDALHVLLNNAGLVLTRRSETREGFEMTLGVNHVGPFLLTKLLLDMLERSGPARVVNVASGAHRRVKSGLDFEDLNLEQRYDGWHAYCCSKLANIYFTRELARRLEGRPVTANSLHPGYVSTRLGKDGDTGGWLRLLLGVTMPLLALDADDGARTSIHCVVSPELSDVSGAYFVECREQPPSPVAREDGPARRLWDITETWVGQGHP
jgi:NAD(P)-dependent dehydrogenase (short-subunit alcohol dehydrogenase family)